MLKLEKCVVYINFNYLFMLCRDVKKFFGTNGIIKKTFTPSAIQGNMVI